MISIGRFSCGEFIGINRPASGFSGLQWDGIVGWEERAVMMVSEDEDEGLPSGYD